MPLTPEVVKTATDVEPLRLPCEVIGAGNSIPSVFFLKNGNPISQDSSEGNYIEEDSAAECSSAESCVRRVLVIEGRRGDEGIYQCVGQVGEDQSTAITSSSYVNIHCECNLSLQVSLYSSVEIRVYFILVCFPQSWIVLPSPSSVPHT